MSENAITRAGLARLNEELERLRVHGRREVADRIRHALSTEANPAESSDYLHVREEQALLERRIAILEERVDRAQVVDPDGENGVVDVGERVRVRDLESGETVEYLLVGSLESDPFQGRISVASPLGRALHGLGAGEVATVDAPKGRRRYELLSIEAERRVDAAAA